MPARITRTRIINRRTSKKTFVDPAQNGAYYARLQEDKLTITAVRNQIVFQAQGVLAARWENDETILLVMREEAEDEPIVERAFRSRVRRDWETENAHAQAHISPDGKFAAIELSLPNPAVAVLPTKRTLQEYAAKVNLGAPAESIEWADSGGLTVTTDQHLLQWSHGMRQFKKTAKPGYA